MQILEVVRVDNTLRDLQNLLFYSRIQNISPFLKEFRNFTHCFSAGSVNGSITCSERIFDVILTSLVQYDKTLDVIGSI